MHLPREAFGQRLEQWVMTQPYREDVSLFDLMHEDLDGDGKIDAIHEDVDGDGVADLVRR